RHEEALLQDRPDEHAPADHDALARIRFTALLTRAATHDDHRGVRRNALDAPRHEREDRERDDDERQHGEDGDALGEEVHGSVAFRGWSGGRWWWVSSRMLWARRAPAARPAPLARAKIGRAACRV